MTPPAFPPEVVLAVTTHVNEDHAAETLLICQVHGARPDATAARMTGVDETGGDYMVTVGGLETPVRIPWGHPITERAQIRWEIVRFYREARAQRDTSQELTE